VATFQGGEITAEDVRARITAEGPLMREQYSTREGQLALVDQMVREQLLALDAQKKGYHRDPRVTRQCDAALSELYMERELDAPERQRPLGDDELEAHFQKHRAQYARPERARIARILLAAPAGDVGARARQKAAAGALLRELTGALGKDSGAFASAARRRSDDPRTRPLGGELPMLTREQLLGAVGPEVADAVFSASRPSGLLPQVLETPEGFQLIQILEREPALEPTFDQVREQLRPRLARERREARQKELFETLSRQANVRLLPENLPAPAPASARTPGPGNKP
jgi:peptidyl-prolyl cis-trans isomerase C